MNDDPLVGRQLANYQLEHVIGRGGMAQVYYGTDLTLQRPVAVKVIDARHRDKPDFARRFVQEARTVAQWRHEHIVQIYYAGEENGLFFFTMEYIDGKDLFDILREGELPYDSILRIIRAVGEALDYAHERGVIHRDVKPSNIMVAGDGRIVLMDFGLALDVEQGSMGETFGSPRYIAPEQARRSSDAIPQSDLYALGVIAYEMLTGSVPFDDPSPASLALQHLTQPPPAPRELNPDLTESVEQVLLKALAKEPQQRYQSGAQFTEALTIALKANHPETTFHTQRAMPVEHLSQVTTPPEKRNVGLGIAALIGGGLFVILLVIVGAAFILLGPNSGAASTEETATAQPEPTQPVVQEEPTSTLTSLPTTEAEQPSPTQETPPSPTIDASPTEAFPTEGYRVIFYYNERSFYLHNPGNENIEHTRFSFTALNNAGATTGFTFSGGGWSLSPVLEDGACDAIEVVELAAATRPPECVFFQVVRTPNPDSEWIFWITRDNSSTFRAQWDGQTIMECPTTTIEQTQFVECEAFLP